MAPLLLAATLLLIHGCGDRRTALQQVRDAGELVVATRPGPTTYFQTPDGPAGVSYELVNRFAERLGVKLRLITVDQPSRILSLVKRRVVHLAAAGMSLSEEERQKLRAGPPYQEITQQLLYHRDTSPPDSLEALQGKEVEVVEECPQGALLDHYRTDYPGIQWDEVNDADSRELMRRVASREIDYTILQSNFVALHRLYYPEVAIAPLALAPPSQLAWAFPRSGDGSLLQEARRFFAELQESGELARILERYYGRATHFDYVHTRHFLRHIEQRLPAIEHHFRHAAAEYGFDWRLLAAMGYQESLWDPDAISPTGVRGVMMLTRATASQLGVKNRLDPEQSIFGGARYLASLKRRLPKRIQEPDRTWMALAAYNIGMGHLEDTRILTQRLGGSPDSWADVKKQLRKLGKRKWYKTLPHGYARGGEALYYVKNIRAYYQMLKWQERKEREEEQRRGATLTEAKAPAKGDAPKVMAAD
ncbi:membrane-bound lytic murein transglycosylase MltF [Endothiovibrio diazotrophicus]